MSLLGQIVGVIDSMTTVLQQLRLHGRWIRDILPILHINRYVHHPEICAALIQVAKEYGPPDTPVVDDAGIGEMVDGVLRDRQVLREHAEQLRVLVEGLPDVPHRSVRAAQRVSSVLTMAIRGSGALDDGQVGWLKAVASQRHSQHYREVEDARLILDEVRRQVAKLTGLLHDIVDNENLLLPLSNPVLTSMRETLVGLEPSLAKACAA